MPTKRERASGIISHSNRKVYRSLGWAKRKIKELKADNSFYRKYKGGRFGPNRWHSNIKITEKGNQVIVRWKSHLRIPMRKTKR